MGKLWVGIKKVFIKPCLVYYLSEMDGHSATLDVGMGVRVVDEHRQLLGTDLLGPENFFI